MNKLRLIRWTRVNDQSDTGIKAPIYKHIGQQITLIVYGQTSTYHCFDDGNRRRPFLAYITQRMHSERCDRPLSWLVALGGRKVNFRGL